MILPWKHRVNGADSTALSQARHDFDRALRACGVSDIDVEAAVIILGELLANACEHGRLPVDITLERSGHDLALTVEDRGEGVAHRSTPDPLAIRGRGFAIIERLGGRIAFMGRPHSRVNVLLPF